jgi:hypothetical protein
MNKLQEALVTAGLLLIVHVGCCIYLLATGKQDSSRKRSLIIIIGNYLLLLLFYVPARLAPERYFWLFALSFVGGFAGLLQYVKWLRKQDGEESE